MKNMIMYLPFLLFNITHEHVIDYLGFSFHFQIFKTLTKI